MHDSIKYEEFIYENQKFVPNLDANE